MKKLSVVDTVSGELLENIEFSGGYNIQYATNEDDGSIKKIRKLDNGKFGIKHWIKNQYYKPIASKLVEKFEEIAHVRPQRILFIEDMEWKPTGGKNIWVARVCKTNKQFDEMTGYEYIVETRNYFIDKMSREQVILLLYHELRHIDTDGSLRKHDIEDWNNIVATFGTDWNKTQGEITDILSEDFDNWQELDGYKKQTSIYDVLRDREE